ncbi:MAG TPA: phosphatase PAP2 family protein [Saprospiraceae bacterium]|jgi:undecaprenyl-diphosphatase|nr:phosphatase PAP2 family protein [Saprospiraceae bacterium]
MNRAAIDRFIMWDRRWVRRINRGCRYRSVRAAFGLISRLGDGSFWYVLMLALLCGDPVNNYRPVLHMALAGMTGTMVYRWLKKQASRPRPFCDDQHIVLSIAPLDRYSFPSGHTLHAVIFTCIAVYHFPILAWLLIPFSALVAASRIVLGLHYPSDVIAGIVIGGVVSIASVRLYVSIVA